MANQLEALIDGDVIRYQVGHACQHNTFVVNGKSFLTPNEANAYCTEHAIPTHNVKKVVAAEIVQAVYHTVDKFIEGILKGAEADSCQIFLTGTGNYREKIATIQPYKGQRVSEKPVHFEAISKYLQYRYKAEVIDRAEADDAMGYNQSGLDTIICTIDKDLDMIPGLHFNWNKQKKYTVTLDEANYFFYKQLLTGDRIDNIQGCIGMGDKLASKALEGCKTEKELYQAVVKTYMEQYEKFCERVGMTCHKDSRLLFEQSVMRDLEENAHLLWIQRKEGELWRAPE